MHALNPVESIVPERVPGHGPATPSIPAMASGGSSRPMPAWARWLHLYASMLGLAALLFFSVTGITLNHPDWLLGSTRQSERLSGQMDRAWLALGRDANAIEKLRVVEHLRRQHGIGGLLDDFRVDDAECSVSLKGPGMSADVTVDRKTGSYRGERIREGWVAVLNDLHKGRNSGRAWAWVIDLSGAILAMVSASGLWLLWYVRRRRTSGLWTGLAGLLVMLAAWWLWVR